MNVMKINGGTPLKGVVRTQGAKNAALPVMAACLLLKGGTLTLDNVPNLYDVNTMIELLKTLGVEIEFNRDQKFSAQAPDFRNENKPSSIYHNKKMVGISTIEEELVRPEKSGGFEDTRISRLQSREVCQKNNSSVLFKVPDEIKWEAPDSLVRKMRASSLVLGPLLARCGRAALPLPGGCSIGSRPIDLHLKGLKQMGAEIEIKNGVVYAEVKGRLRGRRIYLDFPSVGATENLMMAAALATGETIIENIAREPEIDNLAAVLRCLGVPVELEGTGGVRIRGIDRAISGHERVIPDRIEACTYILAGVMTGGKITVSDVIPAHIDSMLAKLEEAGAGFSVKKNEVTVFPVKRLQAISLKTMPFPGFPTDLQPQMVAALSLAGGVSMVEESVFQARFLYAQELNRMGANIKISRDVAVINGVEKLEGALVKATDLRAGAALIIAGLAAHGETFVDDMVHVWRGYEDIDKKLRSLGAHVELLENLDCI